MPISAGMLVIWSPHLKQNDLFALATCQNNIQSNIAFMPYCQFFHHLQSLQAYSIYGINAINPGSNYMRKDMRK